MEYEILARDCRLPPTLQFIMLLEDIEEAGTFISEAGIRSIFQIHFITYQFLTLCK